MRITKRLEIKNRLGLHARAAALLVQTVSRFSSEVKISKDGQIVDGKSIIGLLTLGAAKGSRVRVEAKGNDAEESLKAIEELFEKRFDEGEST